MATAYPGITGNGVVATGVSAGGQLQIYAGDSSNFDGAKLTLSLSLSGITYTFGTIKGEGELLSKEILLANIGSGVTWTLTLSKAAPNTNINLIVVEP